MALSIGTLVGYLKLEDQAYAAALQKNADRTKRFASQASAAFSNIVGPAALVGGLTLAARTAIDLASTLTDSAEAAGLGLEEYQALDFVFRQNGASGEQLTATLAKLQGTVADAANGSKSARENLARLGLHFSELIRLTPAQMLVKVAQAMREAGSDTVAMAAAMDILGVKNLPRLNAGLRELATDGLDKVTAKAKDLGQIVTSERIKLVDEFGDAIGNAGRQAKNAAVNGFGALLEVFNDPDFERAFGGVNWVPGAQPARGNAEQRAAAIRREIAEERRLMRADSVANEERRRREESVARVSARYGNAPAARRGGSFAFDKLEARQRKDALNEQRDALEAQLVLVRKQQEIFQRGLSFTAANDPFIALSESIREANAALESGVVTAVAFKKAIESAATAYGTAQLDQVQNQGALAAVGGQRRKARTFSRTEEYARRLAAQGKFEEANNQINYLKSLDPAAGAQLETALGVGAVGPATAQAKSTQTRAKALEDQVAALVKSIEEVAKKLTVS